MAETIAGLASAAFAAATWVLACILKQSELFEKDVENNIVPLNDEFLRIHTNYVRMFNLLSNSIREVICDTQDGRVSAQDAIAQYQASVAKFREERRDIEGIRSTFRAKIGSILPLCTSEQARTYLTALCAYIINDEDDVFSKEDETLEVITDLVSARGRGDDAFDTPSARLLHRLEKEDDLDKAQSAITTALAGLSLKESSVLKAYFVLRARHL